MASQTGARSGLGGKTLCRNWTGKLGSCAWGIDCRYAHDATGGQLNPLAEEFVPGQRSYTSVPVPLECLDEFQQALESIKRESGAEIYYDSISQSGIIEGTPEQLMDASTKVMATIEKSLQQCSAECCVCFEAPRKRPGPNRNRDRYGLMEGCDHVVCMQCIMNWRKNAKTAREARLGCPVCRKLSHIVVPWHEALRGEERLNVLHQFKERCKTTPCKWSSGGQRCPAGKHCLYDHSRAPQVFEPRREMQLDSDDEDEALFLFEALSNLTSLIERRSRITRALFDSDDDVESDEEISAFLRGLRG